MALQRRNTRGGHVREFNQHENNGGLSLSKRRLDKITGILCHFVCHLFRSINLTLYICLRKACSRNRPAVFLEIMTDIEKDYNIAGNLHHQEDLQMIKFSDIEFYTVEDVAALLNLSKQTVYSYVWQGRLKSRRLGRRTYISEQELKEFVTKGFGTSRRKEASMR